jgi:hypothetical protein
LMPQKPLYSICQFPFILVPDLISFGDAHAHFALAQ